MRKFKRQNLPLLENLEVIDTSDDGAGVVDLESVDEKKGWTEAEGFLLLECWGRPLKKLQNMPYMHF